MLIYAHSPKKHMSLPLLEQSLGMVSNEEKQCYFFFNYYKFIIKTCPLFKPLLFFFKTSGLGHPFHLDYKSICSFRGF